MPNHFAFLPVVTFCFAIGAPAASATIPAPDFILFGQPVAAPCTNVERTCAASGSAPASNGPEWPSPPALPDPDLAKLEAPAFRGTFLERPIRPDAQAVHIRPNTPAGGEGAVFSSHPLAYLDVSFLEERTAVSMAMATAPLPPGAAPFALTLTMLLIAAARSRRR